MGCATLSAIFSRQLTFRKEIANPKFDSKPKKKVILIQGARAKCFFENWTQKNQQKKDSQMSNFGVECVVPKSFLGRTLKDFYLKFKGRK